MATTLLRIAIAAAAFLCGVRAMGYWVMLKFGGVQASQTRGVLLVLCGSALLFVVLTLASAYLAERARGARAVLVESLYLAGLQGIPPIALFAVASKGAVLQSPEVAGLLILFACSALGLRMRGLKRAC